MKKKIIIMAVCMLTSLTLIFGLCMPEVFSKNISGVGISENVSEKTDINIVEALKEAPDCRVSFHALGGKPMSTDLIKEELTSLVHSVINTDKYYIFDCDHFEPCGVESGERILWSISAHVSGLPDYRHSFSFGIVFDEKSQKAVSLESDLVVSIDGDTYFYENACNKGYNPQKELLDKAAENVELYTGIYAEYLGMTLEDISFDHYHLSRYTFNAELTDVDGESVTVKVSYNVENGRYNFNY